jgi:hypothetical protein
VGHGGIPNLAAQKEHGLAAWVARGHEAETRGPNQAFASLCHLEGRAVVTRAYLLKKTAAPSAQKVFLHQVLIPRAIDAVAAVEAGLEKLSLATRRSPAASLAAASGLGLLLALTVPAISRRRTKRHVSSGRG